MSLIWLCKEPDVENTLQTDACPKGYGGICGNQYFRGRFPSNLQTKNIAILEMWAVMVGLKIWGSKLKGKYFWIHVDNEAVATVLNSGASKDQSCKATQRDSAFSSQAPIHLKGQTHTRGGQQNTRLAL